ncbi:hypothetical protein SORBI_3008G088400 [Sorghum bicolor]|uniref:Uncharacterized protein n=1 Tax=Sorghum bicolor TaxID=4558 RepID=A0A1B6PCA1_SORBI|nr:hypothetical protein SORBI_3008G088400 [Sorghum bicolor]
MTPKKIFYPHPQTRLTRYSQRTGNQQPTFLFPAHQSPAHKSHIKAAKPKCSTYLCSPLSRLAAAGCLASHELCRTLALLQSHSTTLVVLLARKFQIESRTPSFCSLSHACSMRSRLRAALPPSCSVHP